MGAHAERVNGSKPRHTRRYCSLHYPGVESPSVRIFCSASRKKVTSNTGIVVFVDRSSKMAALAAVPDFIGGKDTAMLFIDRVRHQHELPLAIISDSDPRFTEKF